VKALAAVAAAIVIVVIGAAGAFAGLWYLPFVLGVVAGALPLGRRAWPPLLLTMAAVAVSWAVPLVWAALRGDPVGATARVVAALAGLPAHAAVTIVLTLLVAVLQTALGCWLARALRGLRGGGAATVP
jgi:hypothetical protein